MEWLNRSADAGNVYAQNFLNESEVDLKTQCMANTF